MKVTLMHTITARSVFRAQVLLGKFQRKNRRRLKGDPRICEGVDTYTSLYTDKTRTIRLHPTKGYREERA